MQTDRLETRRDTVRATLAAALGSMLLGACMVVPVTTEGYDPDCQVITHHMTLKVKQVQELQDCDGRNDCLAQYLVLFGASAVVSGSIVLVGNVVYWAQQQAACTPPPAAAS